ncbi:hypothetical protein [Paenibacillus chitinolyticus]|uniref:Uncharacterized protein n=1 Tax=Paenibacillus chitinolyticus TaxID=79263 RepID=A0ABT4FME2_9BACL|nr:hypothetical protein [Paenibacillus chitinolyticus]MCY9593735.1 hypothetical protein [Paenibacillus chitinolyticus]MCY9599699.1 hypothetical protein [Paenibacillus chitinolyticus]
MDGIRVKDPPQQPLVCKGCIWGRWEAASQFCSKQVCIRGGAVYEVSSTNP